MMEDVRFNQFVDYIYEFVKYDCRFVDAIYGDYIKQMVGVYGFNALITAKLLEGCGVVNGRHLYTLLEKKDGNIQS